MSPAPARLRIDPCDLTEVLALERELGVSHALAQVLVRRGFADPVAARAWLAAAERHEPSEFDGIDDACDLILIHVEARTPITIHGDYDVDGVSSTAILVGVLRELGADVDWFLPSRSEDGYGLSAATVARLAARGTRLLITADCAITAVDEVAAARAAGVDVVVTDHHSPRADGVLPDAPIVHPAVCRYPCVDLCAAGVAYKLAGALLAAAGHDPARADADLDLVALATIADCVPLRGENRRLVRAGLRALATTTRPGLRALMRVSRADPARIDARAVGFRLAPRINAAGRLERADAGLELLLTSDEERAGQIADELDRLNGERRHTETRILFEAEAQVAQLGERASYVLAGEGWHKGVIGIVASRIAERHHRPTVLIALDAAAGRGTGSGRSIEGFDLLGGLNAAASHLVRHGGHRAAAGCEILAAEIDAFRDAFEAHAAATLRPEDLVPVQRADAVVAGDELGLALAEELELLAPFGIGNPSVVAAAAGGALRGPAHDGGGQARPLQRALRRHARRRRRVRRREGRLRRAAGRDVHARAQRVQRQRRAAARAARRAAVRAAADHGRGRAGGLPRRGPRRARPSARRARGPAGRRGRARGRPGAFAPAGGAASAAAPEPSRPPAPPPRSATAAAAASPARSPRSSPAASECSSSPPTRACARATSRRSSAASSCARTRRWSATLRSRIGAQVVLLDPPPARSAPTGRARTWPGAPPSWPSPSSCTTTARVARRARRHLSGPARRGRRRGRTARGAAARRRAGTAPRRAGRPSDPRARRARPRQPRPLRPDADRAAGRAHATRTIRGVQGLLSAV